MITIAEIARLTGVSRGTVDRVLNNRGRVAPEKEKMIRECLKEYGYQPTIATKSLAVRKKELHLGFCCFDHEGDPFSKAIYQSAKEYASYLGQYNIRVSFFEFLGIQWEGQTQVFEEICCADLDGCAFVGMQADDYYEYVKKKGKEMMPYVTYNMEGKAPGRLAHVGCDYMQSGRLACGLAALLTEEKGGIGIVSAYAVDVESFSLRVKGFEKEMKEQYPNLYIVGKVMQDSRQNPFELYQEIEGFINEHPDMKVIYVVIPGDYSICLAISTAAKDSRIKIISNDLESEREIEMVKEGMIAATICQEPEKQGKLPLEILFYYLSLGTVPQQEWYKTDLTIKIRQNL